MLAKRKAIQRWSNQVDHLPLGAIVSIDKKAKQQICKIEEGKDPNFEIKQNVLKTALLGSVDKVARQ